LLYAGVTACSVAAVAVVAATLMPLDGVAKEMGDLTASRSPSTSPSLSNDRVDRAMLESLDAVFSRSLRKTPAQPIAPVTPTSRPQAPPAAAPGIALVGTIGDTTAMIRNTEGQILARSVGQRIGDAEVVSVRRGEVRLRFPGGREQMLRKLSTEPVKP
jgi:hypothetical protein